MFILLRLFVLAMLVNISVSAVEQAHHLVANKTSCEHSQEDQADSDSCLDLCHIKTTIAFFDLSATISAELIQIETASFNNYKNLSASYFPSVDRPPII